MAKFSQGQKIALGLAVGAGVLFIGKSAFAAEGGEGATASPASAPGGGAPGAPGYAADAAKATQVFAGLLTAVGGALAVAPPSNAPYVGAASAVVATMWARLSERDKARVWRGELD